MSDKREFTRVPLRLKVELKHGDRSAVLGLSEDLSLRGVYLNSELDLKEGESCELTIRLGEGPKAFDLVIQGRVVRLSEDGAAIEFEGVHGADALAHLRKLVLYNSEDPERTEEEMRTHLGIERKQKSD
jgi:hypothetical protein